MSAAVLVGVFGVAGALLRFAVDSWFAHLSSRHAARVGDAGSLQDRVRRKRLHWPYATLLVNVAGCFLIGISHGLVLRLQLGPEWQAALATGLAGGLTTFSSWTTATIRLLSEARFGSAAANVALNLVLGFVAAAAGIAAAG